MFKSITAVEPNKILYKGLKDKLKKDNIKNVKTINNYAEDFEIYQKFDLILCMNSFLFIKDKDVILKKFNKLLKPGGYLLISEPTMFLSLKADKERNNEMLSTLKLFINSKDYNLIFYGVVSKRQITYLLEKCN